MLLELFDSVVKRFRRAGPPEAQSGHKLTPYQNTADLNQSALCQDRVETVENDAGPFGTGQHETNSQQPSHFFHGAHDFIVKDSVMNKVEIMNYVTNTIENGKPVLDRLLPYTTPEAAMDSRARYPPPLCHPGTRRRIGAKLETWLDDDNRQWKMVWLHGPAGVGKSAVAQTFAEYCAKRNHLGAAFFFSKPNHRNNPDRVIPTLAYQLATRCHEYRHLLTSQIVNDPSILEAAMHVQFRKLIVDPFSELRSRDSPSVRQPFPIILDGLDECQKEVSQCEIIELISEAVRQKDLPLLWLICSRPEPHIKYTFSRTDFSITCGREELVIDEEARREVDRYLRDGFSDIRAKFWDIVSASWPSEDQFAKLSDAASGLFIVASTALKYIGDLGHANPIARLNSFLAFIRDAHGIGANSPLEALDLLYTRVLSDVPDDVFPTTRRVLFHCVYLPDFEPSLWTASAQVLCNFLRLDQATFYVALRKLHSVIDVPTPEAAATTPLRFYHASFREYLCNPTRSGKFALEGQNAYAEIAKSCLYWYGLHPSRADCQPDGSSIPYHKRMALSTLKWSTDSNSDDIYAEISYFSEQHWTICAFSSDKKDPDLLSQVRQLDFRDIFWLYNISIVEFGNWLYRQISDDPNDNTIRTEPCSYIDQKLFEHLQILTKSAPVKPVKFPVNWGDLDRWGSLSWERQYFLVGCGVNAGLFCLTRGYGDGRVDRLGSDEPPSEHHISNYSKWINGLESRDLAATLAATAVRRSRKIIGK